MSVPVRAPRVSPTPQPSTFNDYSLSNPEVGSCITIFGSSRTEEGTCVFKEAHAVGLMAATRGMSVVSGGYGGTMLAVSQGASAARASKKNVEPAPGDAAANVVLDTVPTMPKIHGILTPGFFPGSDAGNKFLTHSVDATSISERTHLLTSMSRYYIVFPGSMSTLMEFTSIWSLWYMHPKELGPKDRPVMIAFRNPWEAAIKGLIEALSLPDRHHKDAVLFVDSAEEVFAIIDADRAVLSNAVEADYA